MFLLAMDSNISGLFGQISGGLFPEAEVLGIFIFLAFAILMWKFNLPLPAVGVIGVVLLYALATMIGEPFSTLFIFLVGGIVAVILLLAILRLSQR